MLSKPVKHLAFSLLRSSLKISSVLQPSYPSTSFPSFTRSLYPNYLYNSFSTSNDDSKKNSSESSSTNADKEETSTNEEASSSSSKKSKKTKSSSSSTQQDPKPEEKKLKAIQIRPFKLPLDKEEEKIKPETYVLFSSPSPIIPFSQQQGFVRTGNLGTNHISNKLAFFIQNELGEIYTIGLVLENNVNKSLKKNIAQGGTTPPASPS